MIKVTRRTYLEGFTPTEIFEALSDPQNIAQILPRVQKVELTQRDDQARKARLITYMSMGGIFGTIRCDGDLTWEVDRSIDFRVRTPLPVETSWQLARGTNGTDLQVTMSLNLAPLLGPMVVFVPTQQVSDMVAAELEKTLAAIERRMQERATSARAMAA